MNTDTITSISVYSGTALVVGALVWGGFFYKANADLSTLVNAAEVRLRLAASMPIKDKKGLPVAARANLLQQARESLDAVERIESNYAPAGELRAFQHFLEGRYEESARAYAAARQMNECSDEMRENYALNEARMWRAAGRPVEAAAVLDTAREFRSAQRGQAQLERVMALQEAGKSAEAKSLADAIAGDTGIDAMTRIEAGRCLERFGHWESAELAYEVARKEILEGTYALARLKLVKGSTDKALDLLDECFARDGGKAKSLVESDQADWQSVASEARFRRLMDSSSTATPPGR